MKKKSKYKPLRPYQLISNISITNQMMRVSGRRGRLSSGTFVVRDVSAMWHSGRKSSEIPGRSPWQKEMSQGEKIVITVCRRRRYCVGSLFRFQHYVKWAKMNQVARFDTPRNNTLRCAKERLLPKQGRQSTMAAQCSPAAAVFFARAHS